MTAQFVKTPSLLFACAAAASCLIATPVAAGQHSLLQNRGAEFPTDLRAALQQKLSGAISTCAPMAQPHPHDCASETSSPFGSIDWIHQVVAGDDLIDQAMFGVSVAIDGDTALIGSSQKDPLGDAVGAGAVYVFSKSASGWTQTQTLVADDGVLGDEFGISVSLQGDTALIGAYRADIGANDQQGAVYVFRPVAGSWTQTQKLSPADATAGRLFGATIARDGVHALVGTPAGMMGDDPTTAPVYALHEADGSWSITQTIHADDYVIGDVFGYQAALSGTTAVIGAPGATIDGLAARGAAYVFSYADGVWSQGQKLTAADGAEMNLFGWAVALDGTTALVGAPYTNIGDVSMQGAAYAFQFEDGNWYQMQKLTPIVAEEDTRFGLVVGVSGNRAMVATAWPSTIEGVPSFGGAWVYHATGEEGFVPEAIVRSPTDEPSAFTFTGAISAGTLLLGAPIRGSANRGFATFVSPDRILGDGFDGAAP